MKRNRKRRGSLGKHSPSLAALAVVVRFHIGALFGNAIADWTGVLVMTKHLYEKGSAERQSAVGGSGWLGEHSLALFLLVTGNAWVVAFKANGPELSMGTSDWQNRFQVDPGPGVGSDDQAPDEGWVQGALRARRAAYPLSPIVPIDGSNR